MRWRDPFPNHNGGMLAFNPLAGPNSPDFGLLYMGIADGGSGGDPLNAAQNLGMNSVSANGHPEAFQMVETGRAVAFVMDDILLYSLVATSKTPGDYAISADALSVEPYGIMVRKDDVAFKKVVDAAMVNTYKSGAINGIYSKWFLGPVPPKGINLNVPMGEAFKKVVASPTDSGDPAAYK